LKIIKPTFEIWDNNNRQNCGQIFVEPFRHIERCGRICHRSEGAITDDSWKKFFDDVVEKKQHKSITEHVAITRIVPYETMKKIWSYMIDFSKTELLKYFRIDSIRYLGLFSENDNAAEYPFLVTANYRAWEALYAELRTLYLGDDRIAEIEQMQPFNVDFLRECYGGIAQQIYNRHRMVTVFITCDLGVIAEFDRHRVFGFSEESTRYVLYKDGSKKSPDGVTYIDIDDAKSFFKLQNVADYPRGLSLVNDTLSRIDDAYQELTALGFPAEWTRCVLPKATKVETAMSGYLDYWIEFFKLRCDGSAQPQARKLAQKMEAEFKNRYGI
jgi:thymidylate synthase (FAD)